MGMPNLKRITIKSEQELKTWLTRNPDQQDSVMVVTHCNESHRKHVSREQIAAVLSSYSWKTDRRYTLGPDLLGHVITKRECS